MPYGKHRWRTPLGFVEIALAMVLAAGCQQPVVPRIEPLPLAPNHPSPEEPAASTAAPPAPPPARPGPTAPAATTTMPPPLSVPPLPPTPLLDSLDRQAQEVQKIALTALVEPEPKKAPEPKPEPPKPARPPWKPPTAPARPRDVWGDGVKELQALAHDRAADPNAAGELWALRALLLDGLAGPPQDESAARLWRVVLTPLVPVPDPGATDEPSRALAIRSAVEALEDLAALEIVDLELCRKVSGFGASEPLPPSACKAGRSLILYCEIAGLRYEPVGDQYRSRLATHLELVTAEDGKSVWTQPLGTAEDLCRRRRRDYFIPYRITLPTSLSPGRYELRLTQTDLIADRSATHSVPLTVAP